MTGTKRNARVMAALRLLGVGALMLALALTVTGTVAAFDRDTGREFGHGLDNAGNRHPQGLWSDGTTIWVADHADDKLYAYDLTSKVRVAAKEFNDLAAAGNADPGGVWSDGATMWVADWADDKIYGYLTGSRAWDSARDFGTLRAAGNRDPVGIWSDGITMWVADWEDDKLYAYDLATKARIPAKDFDTLIAAGNNDPSGLWSDGDTMWVADTGDNKLYAYDLTSKARVPAKDFETLQAAGMRVPRGIWSDGDTMWVAEEYGHNYAWLFAYNMPEGVPPGAVTISSVSPGAGSPLIVSWRAPSGDAGWVTAYDLRYIRTDADKTVAANWTVVNNVWIGVGPLRYMLTGLDNRVQYDVQVRAVNPVGQGPWSAVATGAPAEAQTSGLPPVFTATRSIPENAAAGSAVGAPFAAIDPDGGSLSYALSGADSGSFAIGQTSGQITLAAGVVLDYATKSSYTAIVTATDGGGLSTSIAVTINVTQEDPVQ
ncbi:MAG: cadherin domain-containing protein [Chloroflexota bacterium]|nr:cadherin domain-containing protein [Chloroflexota bacterium]